MEAVRIECEGATKLPLGSLAPLQGNLKDLSKENYQKLKKEILKEGFSEPVSVWLNKKKYHILNGHQRVRALTLMAEEGYTVPDIPVSLVKAKDKKQAMRKILGLTSQYGEMTSQGLYEFMHEAEIDLETVKESFHFPEVKMSSFEREYFDSPESMEGVEVVDDDQWIVTIDCKTESEMETLFEEFKGRGLKCKLLR